MKHHRGRPRHSRWVFGGIERGSGKCFLVQVPDRTRHTLFPLIQQYILPGTHIISDGWAAYAAIDTINHGIYSHSVVNHSVNFVNPIRQLCESYRPYHSHQQCGGYACKGKTEVEEGIQDIYCAVRLVYGRVYVERE